MGRDVGPVSAVSISTPSICTSSGLSAEMACTHLAHGRSQPTFVSIRISTSTSTHPPKLSTWAEL
eukprot:3462911-Pyramimonas_sp.AAC.1